MVVNFCPYLSLPNNIKGVHKINDKINNCQLQNANKDIIDMRDM